jgi:hypothetical protein
MKLGMSVAAVAASLLLAGCTSPEKSISKDCQRLGMFAEAAPGGDQKKPCACFGAKLKDTMSKNDLKALAKAMKKSKTDDDVESNAKAAGLSDAAAANMLGAAKSCVIGV